MKIRKKSGITIKLTEPNFQIIMRVKGFGFNDFPCAFSSGGNSESVNKLCTLIKSMARREQGATS